MNLENTLLRIQSIQHTLEIRQLLTQYNTFVIDRSTPCLDANVSVCHCVYQYTMSPKL